MIHTFLETRVFRFLLLPFVLVCSIMAVLGAFDAPDVLLTSRGVINKNALSKANIAITQTDDVFETSIEKDICTGEEKDDLLYEKGMHFSEQEILSDSQRVWISPEDTTMLFPKYGFCIQDLFVKNRDTLTGYYVHPRLISVVGVVLEICQEYEARTGRKSQIRINSVVRSIPYNRRIGGVRNSEHLEPLGHAVDIRFAYGTNSEYYNWYFKNSINRRNENMDKLIAAGARSFGFYRWGIHFGVRDREKTSRFHKGIGYVVWDKTKKT